MEAAPFENDKLDGLEKFSLLTSLATLLLGLFFNEAVILDSVKVAIIMGLFILNGTFLYLATKQFIKETWKEMIRDKPELATKFTQKKKKKGKTNAVKVIPAEKKTVKERAKEAWE